jgi:hypothetical protein
MQAYWNLKLRPEDVSTVSPEDVVVVVVVVVVAVGSELHAARTKSRINANPGNITFFINIASSSISPPSAA